MARFFNALFDSPTYPVARIRVAVVPEPGSLALLLAALVAASTIRAQTKRRHEGAA
jgi:hypothetical protein